jgi:hypothetical protein
VFRLGRRRPDGTTERDHLVAYQRATGKTPEDLHVPPLPLGTEQIWAAFGALSGARVPGFGGASSPIVLSEIVAWQQLQGVELVPWEVDTILAIDRAAMAVLSEKVVSG